MSGLRLLLPLGLTRGLFGCLQNEVAQLLLLQVVAEACFVLAVEINGSVPVRASLVDHSLQPVLDTQPLPLLGDGVGLTLERFV